MSIGGKGAGTTSTDWMLFLSPSQQRQSTEWHSTTSRKIL